MKIKKYIWGFLFMAVLLSLSGIGTLRVEAAKKKKQSKYFMAEDICYKIIAKDRVAACGLKLKVDKELIHSTWKSDTLRIPSHVTYRGKRYKVTKWQIIPTVPMTDHQNGILKNMYMEKQKESICLHTGYIIMSIFLIL